MTEQSSSSISYLNLKKIYFFSHSISIFISTSRAASFRQLVIIQTSPPSPQIGHLSTHGFEPVAKCVHLYLPGKIAALFTLLWKGEKKNKKTRW